MIDIAVPRDIDSRCGDIDGVTLYDIDDLQAVVQRNLGARQEIVPQAEEIVEEEIHRFARWLGQAETLPTVSALREHGNRIVEQILAENEGRWESASERDLMRVEAVARAVLSRLLARADDPPAQPLQERSHEGPGLEREQAGAMPACSSCASCSDSIPHKGAHPIAGRQAGEEPAREAERAERPGRADRRDSPRCARSRAPARAAPRRRGRPMRIGTRGSALALAQARLVQEWLGGGEIVVWWQRTPQGEQLWAMHKQDRPCKVGEQ